MSHTDNELSTNVEEQSPVDSVSSKSWSRLPLPSGYEVTFEFHRAFISGGGLQHHAHVMVTLDHDEVFKTQDQPSPPVWNEKCTLYCPTLQPTTPASIVFSVYKKRWTSVGYKLVGTHTIPLVDLQAIIGHEKGKIDIDLTPNKRNLTLHGNLIFTAHVKAPEAAVNTATDHDTGRILAKQRSLSSLSRENAPEECKAKPSLQQIVYELVVEDLGDYLKDPVLRVRVLECVGFVLVLMLGMVAYFQHVKCRSNMRSLSVDVDSLMGALQQLSNGQARCPTA